MCIDNYFVLDKTLKGLFLYLKLRKLGRYTSTSREATSYKSVDERRMKMKREFLKELGLEDDVIDKIMAENGKDIENAKGDVTKLEAEIKTKEKELETLQGQLKKANEQIEEFKDMDIDAIKKAADDYKEKYETAKIEAEKELAVADEELAKLKARQKAKGVGIEDETSEPETVEVEEGEEPIQESEEAVSEKKGTKKSSGKAPRGKK